MYVYVGVSLFHRCCYGGKEDVREGGVTVGRGGQLHHHHWSLLMQSQLWTLHLPFRQMDGMTSISQAINVRVMYILILRNYRYVLAVGLESGQIFLHFCSLDPLEWNLALRLDTRFNKH